MSAVIGLDNYRVGSKNNWRRWQWNRLAERMPKDRDGYVLYLAAEQDLDRSVARSKGIADHQLIAVDMRPDVVKRLRAEGKSAVCGSLSDVLNAWPTSRRIDGVVADFCCGLTTNMLGSFCSALWMGADRFGDGAAISVNLQRGREQKDSNVQRRADSARFLMSCMPKFQLNTPESEKHRGLMFLAQLCVSIFPKEELMRMAEVMFEHPSFGRFDLVEKTILASMLWYRPEFNSYRASVVYMDSVVFTFPNRKLAEKIKNEGWLKAKHDNGDMVRQIAAVMAWNTRRKTA